MLPYMAAKLYQWHENHQIDFIFAMCVSIQYRIKIGSRNEFANLNGCFSKESLILNLANIRLVLLIYRGFTTRLLRSWLSKPVQLLSIIYLEQLGKFAPIYKISRYFVLSNCKMINCSVICQ